MFIKDIITYEYNYAEYIVTDGTYDLKCVDVSLPVPRGSEEPKIGTKIEEIYVFSPDGMNVKRIDDDKNKFFLVEKGERPLGYHLRAEIINRKESLVRIGDLIIETEELPEDLENGDFIEFDADRLDCSLYRSKTPNEKMMIIEDFLESATNVFESMGCKQYGTKFIYEHKEMYITFMLSRSNPIESYHHEFNCTIKELHPEIKPSDITENDFDLIENPRLGLFLKPIAIELDEIYIKEYERLLRNSLEKFFDGVDKRGLKFLKYYKKQGCALKEDAQKFLSRYRMFRK